MSIELRLTNVDPPEPEPKRTIYRDIVNLPDPVKLGITTRYFNYDDVGLYFQITGSATGYTFGTVNLGLLGSGANAYQNLDEFTSRAKPSAEVTESITLTLKAYTDSGYTNLKWTYDRVVTVVFINSADPSYTVDVNNNFDDGTVQGWASAIEAGSSYSIAVATDYVLTIPYSLRGNLIGDVSQVRGRLYKSFITPNKDIIYAIIDIRIGEQTGQPGGNLKNLTIQRNTTLLIYIGRPYDNVAAHYYPKNKWIRCVVPLPKNTTLEIRIIFENYQIFIPQANMYTWLDDFKIISK